MQTRLSIPVGRRVQAQVAAPRPQPSMLPASMPQQPTQDPLVTTFVGALSSLNRALLRYFPQQVPERTSGESGQPTQGRPVQPGALDEITDEQGNVEVPTIRPGEKPTLWRYQLPTSDPRYRPLQGRYELGVHFTE